jgi:hypothetical protein
LFYLASDYFDYQLVIAEQNNVSWQVTNLHHQLDFCYYFRENSSFDNCSLNEKSSIIQLLNYNELTHIYLAYDDRFDQINVGFIFNKFI